MPSSTPPRAGQSPLPPGLISPGLMGRVRGIEIRTRKLASSGVAGNYRSTFRGSGIEFAEAREYVPGDDVRRIDWNITARTGTPWVKEFVEERAILGQALDGDEVNSTPVISIDEITRLREAVKQVDLNDRLREYIVRLVEASREPQRYRMEDLVPFIEFGGSPRAGVFLARAAQAYAFIAGRDYVTPEDIKAIAPDVLRHRLVLTYEAEAQGMSADQIVTRLLEGVGIP